MQGYDFGGANILIPGPYIDPRFPESPDTNVGGARNTLIIGEAEGGVPYNATALTAEQRRNRITSETQALKYLIGGDGYYGLEFFFTCTKDPKLRLPSKAYFVRVNPATQSSGNIKDVTVTNNVIDLKSGRYGKITEQLAKKLSAGTTSGYKLEATFRGNKILEKDNIGYNVFEIQYTGAGTACTMTVNATSLTTTATGASGDNLNISFSSIKKLGELVDTINQHAAYSCKLRYDRDIDASNIDAVTSQDIQTSPYIHTANVQAVIDTFNRETFGEFIASLSTSAARSQLAIDSGFVYLSGGIDGATSNTDWIAAFSMIENYNDIDHVVVLSGDPVIHALSSSHVNSMSKIKNAKYRRFITGASSGKTVSTRIDESIAINDARGEYCMNSIDRIDVVNGVQKKFAPYFMAAIIAGMRNAGHVTKSPTFQNVNVIDAEVFSIEEQEDIIRAGGTYLKDVDSAMEVGHNVSTYQGSGSLIFRIPCMYDTVDYLMKDTLKKVRNRMKAMEKSPDAAMWSELENYMNTAVFPSYRTFGLITDNPNTGEPAFTPIKITVDGEVFKIRSKLVIPAPGHYGFISYDFATVSSVSITNG